MEKTNHSNSLHPIAQARHRELIIQFLAELFQHTGTATEQEHFQAALQAYCDSLHPWLEPHDGPAQPRAVFSVLEEYTVDATGENITVVLSPEGEALFHAWLRRNKIWSDAGLNNRYAWSN